MIKNTKSTHKRNYITIEAFARRHMKEIFHTDISCCQSTKRIFLNSFPSISNKTKNILLNVFNAKSSWVIDFTVSVFVKSINCEITTHCVLFHICCKYNFWVTTFCYIATHSRNFKFFCRIIYFNKRHSYAKRFGIF